MELTETEKNQNDKLQQFSSKGSSCILYFLPDISLHLKSQSLTSFSPSSCFSSLGQLIYFVIKMSSEKPISVHIQRKIRL